MKILYIGMDSSEYSGRSHEVLMAEELAKSGNDVIGIFERTPHYEPGEKPENLNIEVMPIDKSSFSDSDIKKILDYDFNIIFCSSIAGLLHGLKFKKLTGKPCVVQVLDVPCWRLNNDPNYPSDWFDTWKIHSKYLEDCDKIIVNSPQTEELLKGLNQNLKNFELLYYGIDTHKIDSVLKQEKKDFIVWCSGLRFYKGLDFLLYALATMDKKIPLLVIGVGDDTELCIETEKGKIPFRYIDLAYLLGVQVHFVGGVDDDKKFELIKRAKLAVISDISKSVHSLFCLEAVYCGVPCITGNFPIAKARFENSVIYVDDIFNTKAWGEKIENVLLNIDLYSSKAYAEKDWILKNRSFKSQAKKFVKIFEQCINGAS